MNEQFPTDRSTPAPNAGPDILDSASPAPRPRNRMGVALVAVAVGAGALGVTSIASAASNTAATTPGAATTTPAPGSTAPAPVVPNPADPNNPGANGFGGHGPRGGHFRGGPGGGPGGGLRGAGEIGSALHGEFVVQKADGTYQTVDTQQGAVTAVSASAITVKSDDGFSKSYTVTAATIVNAARDGIGSVKVGDVVHLDATVAGSTATVVDVMDETTLKAAGAGWGHQPKAPKAPKAATVKPSAASTS